MGKFKISGSANLIDADFSLHILQAFLDDGDEGSRGHQSAVDVGLADVALYAKGERWVGEACRGKEVSSCYHLGTSICE